jgi:hypothetical protein
MNAVPVNQAVQAVLAQEIECVGDAYPVELLAGILSGRSDIGQPRRNDRCSPIQF